MSKNYFTQKIKIITAQRTSSLAIAGIFFFQWNIVLRKLWQVKVVKSSTLTILQFSKTLIKNQKMDEPRRFFECIAS